MESWRAGDDERRTMNDVLYRSIKRPVESCVRRVESNPVDWIRFISAVLCTRWKNFPHPPIHSKANQPASQSVRLGFFFLLLLCYSPLLLENQILPIQNVLVATLFFLFQLLHLFSWIFSPSSSRLPLSVCQSLLFSTFFLSFNLLVC